MRFMRLLVKLEEGRTLDGFGEAYAEALKTGGPWNARGLRGGICWASPGGIDERYAVSGRG